MSLHNPAFDFAGRVAEHDRDIAHQMIGSLYRPPDLIIAPAGHGEYLFRWYVIPRNTDANVYFHIQTESDPERPLHDHPWDNTSVILAGGYDEILDTEPAISSHVPDPLYSSLHRYLYERRPGDVIHRKATWAHRLIRPKDIPYTMSLFTTGPKVRKWGFWTPDGWMPYNEVTTESDGKSQWKGVSKL